MNDRLETEAGNSHAVALATANLYRAFFTGAVLSFVARRTQKAAADFVFAVFRRQQSERFLPGLAKLGLEGLPAAVACAQYHYLSNRIGGVSVEYMYESDRKAWIRYAPPRWIWWGTAICGIPGEVSRAMLLGWHAQNGMSLNNKRLGFVCTKQMADGGNGLEGYYFEYDDDLEQEQRLRFAPHEDAPDFDVSAAPVIPTAQWPEERLRKAHTSYAMEYGRNAILAALDVFGPEEACSVLGLTARLVGMQFYHELAHAAGIEGNDPESFAQLMIALAQAQGDAAVITKSTSGDVGVVQTGWNLMKGISEPGEASFLIWSGLWEGALAAHNRRLEIVAQRRPVFGSERFEWRIQQRPAGR